MMRCSDDLLWMFTEILFVALSIFFFFFDINRAFLVLFVDLENVPLQYLLHLQCWRGFSLGFRPQKSVHISNHEQRCRD